MLIRHATIAGLMLLLVGAAKAEAVRVVDPWIRVAPPTARVMAGYMTIVNDSTESIKLTGASSPLFGMIEMHLTEFDAGNARMIKQDELDLPAGGRLVLEPGSYHLMLMMPREVPQQGEQVELTLEFADGQTQAVMATVRLE